MLPCAQCAVNVYICIFRQYHSFSIVMIHLFIWPLSINRMQNVRIHVRISFWGLEMLLNAVMRTVLVDGIFGHGDVTDFWHALTRAPINIYALNQNICPTSTWWIFAFGICFISRNVLFLHIPINFWFERTTTAHPCYSINLCSYSRRSFDVIYWIFLFLMLMMMTTTIDMAEWTPETRGVNRGINWIESPRNEFHRHFSQIAWT